MPYVQRYVAFFDILGFSDIVIKTERDTTTTRFDALVRTLGKINERDVATEQLGDDFQFQSFSDSIVMSSYVSPQGFLFLLRAIRQLALDLLRSGLLIRGAIAKGPLHHSGPIMFGPAFLKAYRIENNIAEFPRIILSSEVYDDFRRLQPGLRNPSYILADDGPPYLHILQDIGDLNTAPATEEHFYSDTVSDAQSLQRILQNLIDNSIHEPRHFAKTRWFGLYWNGVVGFTPGVPVGPVTFPGSRNVTWIR
jgi:signal transduction histidine kinase